MLAGQFSAAPAVADAPTEAAIDRDSPARMERTLAVTDAALTVMTLASIPHNAKNSVTPVPQASRFCVNCVSGPDYGRGVKNSMTSAPLWHAIWPRRGA